MEIEPPVSHHVNPLTSHTLTKVSENIVHYDFSRLHVVDFSCVGVSVIKPYIGIDFYVFIMNTTYALS